MLISSRWRSASRTAGRSCSSRVRLGHYGEEFVLCKFRKFRNRHMLGNSPADAEGRPAASPGWAGSSNARRSTRCPSSGTSSRATCPSSGRGRRRRISPIASTAHIASCCSYKPGIFGPSQAVFRSESTLHEPRRDPEQFYRAVLFPMKARLDLAYFPHGSTRLDVKWAARCVLAVLGLLVPARWRDRSGGHRSRAASSFSRGERNDDRSQPEASQ